jgi:hypothetical protein
MVVAVIGQTMYIALRYIWYRADNVYIALRCTYDMKEMYILNFIDTSLSFKRLEFIK